MATRIALSRGTYVEAALEVIAEKGVDKLSMRNVASRLKVSPMAMYKHFPTKDELLAASFEEFIARANVIPDERLAWDKWTNELAHRMYEALCRELSWVPLLGSLPMGEQATAVTAAFVDKLGNAGFSVDQSLRAYLAVIQVVVGALCLRSSIAVGQSRRPMSAGGNAPDSRSARAMDAVLKRDQIEIGLPLIIAALAAQKEEAI